MHTFCVYSAPDEARIREHAAAFGGHRIDGISVIAGRGGPRGDRRLGLFGVPFPAHAFSNTAWDSRANAIARRIVMSCRRGSSSGISSSADP